MLKSHAPKPLLFSVKGGELSLSGPDLIEILKAVLDKGMPFRFRARGVSMSPFIRDDDVITISPLSGYSLRLGDVVAFVPSGKGNLVVHRIVGKKGISFRMKGDNVSRDDGLVPEKNILGYVTKVERNGKEVYAGTGPERFLIAFLTQKGPFFPKLLPLWRFVRPLIRPFIRR